MSSSSSLYAVAGGILASGLLIANRIRNRFLAKEEECSCCEDEKKTELPQALNMVMRPGVSAAAVDLGFEGSYKFLLENNRQFVTDVDKADPAFFRNLVKGQNPDYLLIGCSDSRVPPDRLTGTVPGQMFLHRNVANVVVSTDINIMAVLQYAVEVLKVKHVIVMGHYLCGGVKAAMTTKHNGSVINKWLRNIKDVYRMHTSELDTIKDEAERFDRMVELNVIESAFNIYKTNVVQMAWKNGHHVQVHGWVCDIRKNGLIKDLHVENRPEWKDLDRIYEFDFDDKSPATLINTSSVEKDSTFAEMRKASKRSQS